MRHDLPSINVLHDLEPPQLFSNFIFAIGDKRRAVTDDRKLTIRIPAIDSHQCLICDTLTTMSQWPEYRICRPIAIESWPVYDLMMSAGCYNDLDDLKYMYDEKDYCIARPMTFQLLVQLFKLVIKTAINLLPEDRKDQAESDMLTEAIIRLRNQSKQLYGNLTYVEK